MSIIEEQCHIDDSQRLYLIKIEELDFTVRTINCLKRMGIDYLYELTSKTAEELMNTEKLQAGGLLEITQKLSSRGLCLRDPSENKKVYIVANTMREDFIIHAATADKELAETVYAKLYDEYHCTDYEKDLEILEFSDKDALDLINKKVQADTILQPKNPCATFDFKVRRLGKEQETECILTQISNIKNGVVTVPSCDLQGRPVRGIEYRDIFRDSRSDCSSVVIHCNSLTSITIPEGVQWLGNNSFASCYSLRCVSLPDSLEAIGRCAFADCFKLEHIVIPDNVTTIGDYAFSRCESLTSITIPPSVKNIGRYAFRHCKNLLDVSVPEHCNIANNAFHGTAYAKKNEAIEYDEEYFEGFDHESDDFYDGEK